MSTDDNKTKEQELVKSKFRQCGYRGLFQGATGVGKTKIGVDLIVECLEKNPDEVWKIIVPTENLRDNEWKLEFIKWGYSKYLQSVQIECIQTAYKWNGQSFNAVVDEVHTTVSPEYKSFYLNNNIDKLICLTATIDSPEKLEFITAMAPIVHTTDMNRARELDIVAPYYIFNLGLSLGEESQKKYDEILKAYTYYESQLGGPIRAFKTSSYIIKTITAIPKEDRTEEHRVMIGKAHMYWAMMQKRKNFLYNCQEKVDACMEIINMFPDRKALIFSETISFAERIHEALPTESTIFHSKMSKNDKKDALKKFEIATNQIRVISAVKALNAGFNVPECSLAINASGSSKWLDMVQRQGRISRKQDNKIAIFVNLYMTGTQDLKWVKLRTNVINTKYVKWIEKTSQIII
jgi:superfamily II DNA or RNA helicase